MSSNMELSVQRGNSSPAQHWSYNILSHTVSFVCVYVCLCVHILVQQS